jgi:hypothetical protein
MIRIRIIVQINIIRTKIKILIGMKSTLIFKVIYFNKISIQSSLFQKEITILDHVKSKDNSVLRDLKTTMNMEAN